MKDFFLSAVSRLCVVPTGPKLYKEPSAKSNKHIIQNALAHCCLAGKVNEGQKNKILDVCFVSVCINIFFLTKKSVTNRNEMFFCFSFNLPP